MTLGFDLERRYWFMYCSELGSLSNELEKFVSQRKNLPQCSRQRFLEKSVLTMDLRVGVKLE